MLSAPEFRKRLYGWLSYAFASEVFVIVSLTLFLPICLEQFARDNGFLLPDRTTPCSTVAKNLDTEDSPARCVVKLGFLWIDTASFSLYVYSISVALQALTVISVGGIADNLAHRKRLLLAFALQGAFAAILFLILASSSPLWFFSALLAICANVGFGVSVVAMNAYLPSLARDSPEVAELRSQLEASQDPEGSDVADTSHIVSDAHTEDAEEPLISRTRIESSELRTRYDNELSRATSRISSLGIALGYGAGICLLLVALIPVTKLKGSTFSLCLAIGLSGIWWTVFSIPAAVWLPGSTALATPGTPESAVWVDNLDITDGKWNIRAEVVAAWKRLGGMLRWQEIKKLRNTFKYLAAWFLLSDGFTTITSTAILFGKTSLNMQPSALILIGVLTPCAGILGSLLWPMIQRKFLWSNLKILVILVILCSAIPAYGCLGFVFQGRTRFGGLTSQGEMFGLAVYFGCVYGAFQSYARAFYAELLPPGEEARWYGLFSITDKSSSFVGPLFVGVIADMTGNIRYAFFFLVFMIWAAVPILMSVDVERGRKDAREYRYSYSSRDGRS
ncbi:autophagy-related protein 22-like protein [Desarmillaria tabescens]|uniref:Autophagy-related protein n=1 Tax=Armillaria tabescens TaxID=1929756 RepID=A0AA39MZT5_ARMTA|nr:autophagy-related protein 22-like protein [Desarmillaria tabescens]KAK0452986.1 autophagy-related protein 22-like protein [Desarmillaria tabescens]